MTKSRNKKIIHDPSTLAQTLWLLDCFFLPKPVVNMDGTGFSREDLESANLSSAPSYPLSSGDTVGKPAAGSFRFPSHTVSKIKWTHIYWLECGKLGIKGRSQPRRPKQPIPNDPASDMVGHEQGERSSVQEKLEESTQCLENRAGLSESW